MNIIGIIPARYNSQRLPDKMLKTLIDKPLLQWTWEAAKKSHLLERVIIACDDKRIEETAKRFGAEVVLTSDKHRSGTDRISEAASNIDTKIIVNIQADEPLIHPDIIDSLSSEMLHNSDVIMATVKRKITDQEEINNPNVVKVVCDKHGYALYFSRYPIPYYREKIDTPVYHKHLGIYAYRKDFLYTFKNLPVSYLENAEKLEQLRVIEEGYKIKVIETNFDSCGVDTEDDFHKVEKILQKSLGK